MFDFFTAVIIVLPSMLLVGIISFSFGITLGKLKEDKENNENNITTPEHRQRTPTQTAEDNTKQFKCTTSSTKFDDIAGYEEVKKELQEVIDFFHKSNKFKKMGAKMPKGILLSGAPGTGKTLFAKAVAGEAGVSFIFASGSEFINKYVGTGANNIRSLFNKARANIPCIVFIDEIDSIASKRYIAESGGDREYQATTNQLLTELDGFDSMEGIVVIAATNMKELLDPAITRPGRIDRNIIIGLPDIKTREEILRLHAKGKPMKRNIDFKKLSQNTSGLSGAQLANIINEAAIFAVRNNHNFIEQIDIESAERKELFGINCVSVKTEKSRQITAYHEAGHAVISLINGNRKIREITILSHGAIGGYTWYNGDIEMETYQTQTDLKKTMVSLMGGRAAEKIIFNEVSTGSKGDLSEATKIAFMMVTKCGMDDRIGPVSVPNRLSNNPEVVSRIQKLLKDAEKEAMQTLSVHEVLLHQLAEELLKNETLSEEDVENIFEEYNKSHILVSYVI